MHVHLGFGGFYGVDNVEVGLTRVLRMNPALHADFRRTPRPGFLHTAGDFGRVQIVGLAA